MVKLTNNSVLSTKENKVTKHKQKANNPNF